MKLYFFPVAPNPTKVRLYIAEKRAGGAALDVSEELVDLRAGAQKSAEHLARNAFGRLPVLELGDGTYLTESLAIIEYLEELHPEPPMIGSTALQRARVREIERIAESGILGSIARIVHATNSPLGWPPRAEVAEMFRGILVEACDVLNDRLADGRPFLAGDRPSIADCTMAAGLQFGRYGGVTLEPRYEHLVRWDEAYRRREAAEAVLSL